MAVVTATHRSPLREAFLLAGREGRAHTLTSNHSYGGALDIVVVDGNRGIRQRVYVTLSCFVWRRPGAVQSGSERFMKASNMGTVNAVSPCFGR